MVRLKKAIYKWLANRLEDSATTSTDASAPFVGHSEEITLSESAPLSTSEIAERTAAAVVVIESLAEDGEKTERGSGYLASSDGVIVTCYHVIRGVDSLRVRFSTGEVYPIETVVGYSIINDIAALQTAHPPALPLKTDFTATVKVGHRVIAIGDPLGLENTVSEGIVSGLREENGTHLIQTQAPIAPGSSGGPLLNDRGNVIGLVTKTRIQGQNLNFAVSARHIAELLKQRRLVSIEQMLSETLVVKELSSGTTSISAGDSTSVEFVIPTKAQDDAVLEGKYTVSGLFGNELYVALCTRDNSGEWAALEDYNGKIEASSELEVSLPAGEYSLVFSNEFSKLTKRSLTLDLSLWYYR